MPVERFGQCQSCNSLAGSILMIQKTHENTFSQKHPPGITEELGVRWQFRVQRLRYHPYHRLPWFQPGETNAGGPTFESPGCPKRSLCQGSRRCDPYAGRTKRLLASPVVAHGRAWSRIHHWKRRWNNTNTGLQEKVLPNGME